jgi:hypothetical protein
LKKSQITYYFLAKKNLIEYFKPIYDDIDKCSFSIGWLAGFKKRFKVSRQAIIGESGSVDKDLIERARLYNILK